MLMNRFFEKYKVFLLAAGVSCKSTESYVSYLKGASRNLLGISREKFELFSEMTRGEQERFCENLMRMISLAQQDNNTSISKKTLSNYRSAVNMLIAFIKSEEAPCGTAATSVQFPLLSGESFYSKEDIKKNFLARLNTQDRFYDFGCFPIRLINKIAKIHGKTNLFGKLLNSVKFVYGVNDCFEAPLRFAQLKDIDGLYIKDGKAYISINNQKYPIFTEEYCKGEKVGYIVANVNTFADLSLDHDTPMYTALSSFMKLGGNVYQIFSNNVLDYINLKKWPNIKRANNLSREFLDSKEYKDIQLPEDELIKEVVVFLNSLSITVMQRNYNSSKNKN